MSLIDHENLTGVKFKFYGKNVILPRWTLESH